MAVLKTTSPAPSAADPKAFPATTVPSSRASRASLMDHLPADDRDLDAAAHLPAVERRVARLGAPLCGVVWVRALDVEDGDIGRRSARERPTLEAEQLRPGG